MALDQIWKQQLALVTYGNEYLTQDLSFNHWLKHQVFNQHQIQFRDLLSQHLLAQHFQIWLEHLKQQGVRRLSLHQASILNDEKNPHAKLLENAVDVSAGDLSPLLQTAKDCGISLSIGFNEREGDFSRTTLFNSNALISHEGKSL